MGISVFLVWQKGLASDGVLLAFVLFWIQLAINAMWSIIFFRMKSKGGGVITIIVLWFLILATTVTTFRVSVWAGAMMAWKRALKPIIDLAAISALYILTS